MAIVEQRPPAAARRTWLRRLGGATDAGAAIDAVLSIDDPMCHLGRHPTDRFVPRELLADDTFLERNLGGWSPVWFGCVGIAPSHCMDDPLLGVLEVVVDYGARIAATTAPRTLVAERLGEELDGGAAELARGASALLDDGDGSDITLRRARALVDAARGAGPLSERVAPLLAYDALLELLYRLELRRRDGVDEARRAVERDATELQRRLRDELGVAIMLKGEYIMGRGRRSTVLLAEGLGVVVKQPACEPEHDIQIGARTWRGAAENWPVAAGDGRMQTPRARMAAVVADRAVAKLDRAFGRDVTFSTVLGLSVEPWVAGPTLAALVRRDPGELTAARYDEVLVHQLVCEELGVDNPDWHAANFIVADGGLVHVDWGAARLLAPDERSGRDAHARLDHVVQIAYSFQDEALAERTRTLHRRATGDPEHVERLRRRAGRLAR